MSAPQHRDLYVHNAHIWTGDGSQPWASCALIRDGRFAFVGREAAAPGASAIVLDGGGRLVVPGFTDAHVHLLQTGMAMPQVDLKACPSVEEAVRRVAARAAATAAGAWVRGHGWHQNDWPGSAFPSRQALDAAAPDHPVVLTHTSGHCVWVNSVALRLAGITAATAPPPGGAIDIGHDGEPSGILRDNAARLVESLVPPPSAEERRTALQRAVAHAHCLGVTGVHAMNVGRGELAAMRALHAEGALRLRTRVFLAGERLDGWTADGDRTGVGDELLRIGGVKLFADGALGSMTAWMLEPYDGTDDCGLPLQAVEELESRVRRCLEAGLAPAVHAIGDRANHEVLGMFERLEHLAPNLPRRIEHAQLLSRSDLPRFAALGVTASVQPIHATQDMAAADRVWGARGRDAYAFASLLASGAPLAFGSDTPVETMDPIAGLHAAVTRRDARGHPPDGWYPAERVTLEQALRAYTAGAARAVREDGAIGRIATGGHADFVVLSQDVFAFDDPMQMLDARADLTVVGGEVVYERPGAD